LSARSEAGDAAGRVITFYSYKGGTGRSMALANLAWILASNGQRVLAIDWDLEAPGLHRYFQPFLRDKSLASSEGIIDFIVDFAVAAVSPSEHSDDRGAEWYLDYANLMEYACSLDWTFPGSGTVDFVPAGRQDAGYATRVNSFHWQHFYDKLGGGVFLEEVKRRLRAQYDYILIDSRTGVSDTSGVCTVQMPDDLVVCFTLNQQSIEGAAAAAASAREQRQRPDGTPGIRVLPLVTRVDSSEKEKLDIAHTVAREYFDGFLDWLDEDQIDPYWGGSQVPYVPFYAYEEVLATFGDAAFQKGTMLSAIESLAQWITEGEVTSLGSIEAQLRLETLQRFARQPKSSRVPGTRSIFYVSYAREDQDDQMTRLFSDLNNEVRALTGVPAEEVGYFDWTRLRPGDDFGEKITAAIGATQIGICFLSPTYVRSEYCLREAELFRSQGKPVILVNWISTRRDDVPEVLRGLPRIAGGPQGFRALLRAKAMHDEYQAQLSEVTQLIADLAVEKTQLLAEDTPAETPFIVLAERNNRIRTVRENAHPYGTRRRDWKPFWSMQGPTAGEIAREAMRRCNLNLRLTSLHKARELFVRSRKANTGAIILVDPWTLLISEHKDLLREILKRRQEVPILTIVCYDRDNETVQRRTELDALVLSLVTQDYAMVAEEPEALAPLIDGACGVLSRSGSQAIPSTT
jgi:FxsC-like protein